MERFYNYLTSITISLTGKEKCLGVATRNNGFFPFCFFLVVLWLIPFKGFFPPEIFRKPIDDIFIAVPDMIENTPSHVSVSFLPPSHFS